MTDLFDTKLPPLWYILLWVFLIGLVRVVLINPLVAVVEKLIARLP